ncbi:MAG: hypothetical protein WBP12_02380 [Candidatus Saccharimonas sp.]
MGFITEPMVAAREEQLHSGSPTPEFLRLRYQSAAEFFCDPFTLEDLKDRICVEVERQFMQYGHVAMVFVSAPEVTEDLHEAGYCALELLFHLQSYEARTHSVTLLFHKGEGGSALPRVQVTFQPMLIEP